MMAEPSNKRMKLTSAALWTLAAYPPCLADIDTTLGVFYDVVEATVEVLAIVSKDQAQAWLDQEATRTPPGGSGEGEG